MKFINIFLPLVMTVSVYSYSIEKRQDEATLCYNKYEEKVKSCGGDDPVQEVRCSKGLSDKCVEFFNEPLSAFPECTGLITDINKFLEMFQTNLKQLGVFCIKDEQGKYCPFSVTAFNDSPLLEQYKASAEENTKSTKCTNEIVEPLENYIDYITKKKPEDTDNINKLKEGLLIMKSAKSSTVENDNNKPINANSTNANNTNTNSINANSTNTNSTNANGNSTNETTSDASTITFNTVLFISFVVILINLF